MSEILIVDDDPSVGTTFARMLEAEGYTVTRVASGAEGLAFLASETPSAIILDMRMPEMDGLDFLRAVRGRTRLGLVPIGIITGDYFLKDEVLAELDELGIEVRYKPVWLDDLIAFAKQLLGQGRDETSNEEGAP